MTVRYFVPEMHREGGLVALPETESHHASTVMRIRPGEPVTLFDGQGYQAEATIDSVSRRRVTAQAARALFLPRDNPCQVSMAIAMPKGDRARELIERLTELGVERVVPVHCQRSPWAVSDGAVKKWQRVMIEACKQSRRNRLMEIEPLRRFDDYLARPLGEQEVAWLAHPGGKSIAGMSPSVAPAEERPAPELRESPLSRPPNDATQPPATEASPHVAPTRLRIRVAVGPEGGFTDEESMAAQRLGWIQVDLGERIYRIETAAVILAIKAAGI